MPHIDPESAATAQGGEGDARNLAIPLAFDVLRTLLNSLPDLVFAKDIDARVVFCNSAAEAFMGIEESELVGKTVFDVNPVELAEQYYADDLRVLRQGESIQNREEQIRDRSGEFHWHLTTKVHLCQPDGKITGLLCICRNIEQQKRDEHALLDSERLYRNLFEMASDALVLIDNETGAVIEANPAATRLYGFTHEEWLQMNHADVSAEPNLTRAAAFSQQTAVPVRWHRKKDGTTFPVEITARHFEWHGREVHVAAIRDIAERLEREKTLRRAHDHYFGLLERFPTLIWRAGVNGQFDYLNQTWLAFTGRSTEQEAGEGWTDGIHPDDIQNWRLAFKTALSHREPFCAEYRFRRHDGQFRWIENFGQPFNDLDGNFAGFIGACHDVTDRKQATETLEQHVLERSAELKNVNKELEDFAYSISHDLRAPLRAINGFSQILANEHAARLDPDAHRLLNLILSEGKRMSLLIDSLLDFARLQRRPFTPRDTDMTMLARRAFDDCAAQAPDRQIDFKIEGLPCVYGDPGMLKHVWLKLVSNAIKFTRLRSSARIEIAGRVEQDQALFYIKDNGAGFSMKYAGKLFRIFQRLHGDHEFEGTGVGLAIVHRLIERHGGKIWAEGTPDQGATFYFTLPRAKNTDPAVRGPN